MSDPTIEILNAPPGHYRWKCSCGSMGIRLCYKESVQALADTHMRNHITINDVRRAIGLEPILTEHDA
jgi:hypothetical protein